MILGALVASEPVSPDDGIVASLNEHPTKLSQEVRGFLPQVGKVLLPKKEIVGALIAAAPWHQSLSVEPPGRVRVSFEELERLPGI